jgi:hypothetical protein
VSPPELASLLLLRPRSARAAALFRRDAASALGASTGVRFSQVMFTTVGPGGVTFPLLSPSRRALLVVWDDEAGLDRHLAGGSLRRWRDSARESLLIRLRVTRSKGTWDGRTLFAPRKGGGRDPGPVAVLTRVAMRWAIAPELYGWALPHVARQLDQNEAALLSVGMTERPVRIGATFSLWRSLAEMQRFGYHHRPHGAVQRRAREHHWFDEELFVRFAVLGADGSWRGRRFSGPLVQSQALPW